MPQLSPMMGFMFFIMIFLMLGVFASGISMPKNKVLGTKTKESSKPSMKMF